MYMAQKYTNMKKNLEFGKTYIPVTYQHKGFLHTQNLVPDSTYPRLSSA